MGERSVAELYAGCYQRLVVQLYPVVGDLGEAQDLVQEAFVRLLDKPARLRTLDSPEAWLRTVAVNLARSRLRRRKVLTRLLHRRELAPRTVPGTTPDYVALVAALRRLPTGRRLAIALYYLADLPVEEVARTLGVSAGTVKAQLSRGRRALAAYLDERADDEPADDRTDPAPDPLPPTPRTSHAC